MSFSSDPFHVLTITKDRKTGLYRWHCESCGAGWKSEGFAPIVTIGTLEALFQAHVRNGHKLNPSDTESWSVP